MYRTYIYTYVYVYSLCGYVYRYRLDRRTTDGAGIDENSLLLQTRRKSGSLPNWTVSRTLELKLQLREPGSKLKSCGKSSRKLL